jgi:hypothetical protein
MTPAIASWRKSFLLLAVFGTLGAAPARAAPVSFYLDQSNAEAVFADGVPYLRVTIADGAAGAIDFTVSILPAVLAVAGANFGIQSFGFNFTGAATAMTAGNLTGLPAGWGASTNKGQDGFGKFEFVVGDAPGGGNVRVAPVVRFSITGISGDSVYDYVALSGGRVTQGHVYYAAHVAGFTGADNLLPPSTYFGGSRPAVKQAVPVPPAAWLLGSALVALGGLRRRAAPQSAR